MYKKKKILAVIMARAGSKGIKNKNLKKIGKNSLVSLAANISNSIKIIDKSIISTDSIKIGEEGKKNKLDFFFLRPKKISGGKIPDQEVLFHALTKAEKKYATKFDVVVSLPPTTPTRKKDEVIKAIKKLVDKKYNSVWTISSTDSKFHPDKSLKITKNRLSFFTKIGHKIRYRQQLKKIYHRNGVAYVVTRRLIQNKTLINKNSSYLLSKLNHVSIDTKEDLLLAKRILHSNNI